MNFWGGVCVTKVTPHSLGFKRLAMRSGIGPMFHAAEWNQAASPSCGNGIRMAGVLIFFK